MSEQTQISRPKQRILSRDIEGFDSLAGLALDMRSAWNHATDQVWRQLDPVLWELTHNPWVVLQTVSREKLQRVLADPVFRKNSVFNVKPIGQNRWTPNMSTKCRRRSITKGCIVKRHDITY